MSLLTQFSPYSLNSNNINEINLLKPLSFENQSGNVPRTSNLVVVLVEDRLFNDLPAGSPPASDLISRLLRLKKDLLADGYSSWFIQAKVYDGAQHRDGSTLLAIREFFKAIKQANPKFAGAMLVGSFPDAMLVRRWLWEQKKDLKIGNVTHDNTTFMRIVPEPIAGRADIVLADLDGNWKNIYEQGPKELESIKAIPKTSLPTDWSERVSTFESSHYSIEKIVFEDFFWINDSDYQTTQNSAGELRLRINGPLRNPELTPSQNRGANPISIPDIFISRINARSIAIGPDPNYTDQDGKTFLDSTGTPRTITAEAVLDKNLFNRRDPVLERQLLINYFDRNHSFRIGGNQKQPKRTAAIAYPKRQFSSSRGNTYLKKASSSFVTSINNEDANLLDYVKWLKTSASLRGIIAHSSAWNTAFGEDYDIRALERITGKPWRWKNQVGSLIYKPSFDDQGAHADLYLHRTLWANKILRNAGADLLIHSGCSVNTPNAAASRPYNDNAYGSFQNGEGILFYLNSLAILARAKVYNDHGPLGFVQALKAKNENAHFGGGWKTYFENDSRASNLTSPSSKKRSYPWSILGDWTLHLFYRKQDCIAINPNLLRVEKKNNTWKVTDGRSWIKSVPTRAEAEKILNTMTHYGFTQQCFVGRPNPSFEYYLINDKTPNGSMPGEDKIQIHPMACEIKLRGNKWFLMEGNSSLKAFPNYEEARLTLSILRRYEVKYMCYVNRPNPILTYFRR